MNQSYEVRAYLAWNLQEAFEALEGLIATMEPDREIDEVELQVALAHIYQHLNTAWNARDAGDSEITNGEMFDKWIQFPQDLDLIP